MYYRSSRKWKPEKRNYARTQSARRRVALTASKPNASDGSETSLRKDFFIYFGCSMVSLRWMIIAECRWRERVANGRDLDGLAGQVTRSSKQTMRLFLSVEGWSEHVVPLLKQNAEKSIILMHGFCVRCVLSGEVDLRDFVLAKAAVLSFESEPFLGAPEYLARRTEGSLPKLVRSSVA